MKEGLHFVRLFLNKIEDVSMIEKTASNKGQQSEIDVEIEMLATLIEGMTDATTNNVGCTPRKKTSTENLLTQKLQRYVCFLLFSLTLLQSFSPRNT